MKKAFALLSFIFILSLISFAQDISFNQRSIELGEIQYWSKSPAIFLYTNQSDRKLAVLRIDADQGLRTNFKIRYLKPGETDSIIVFNIPKEKGIFKKGLSVYFNTTNKPIKLRISGNIIGMDECPGSEVIEENKIKYIKVIDAQTQKTISRVHVETYQMHQLIDKNRTRTDGKFKIELNPSLYEFVVNHPNYLPLDDIRYVRISEKTIILELQKVKKDPAIAMNDQIVEVVEEKRPKEEEEETFEIVFEEKQEEDVKEILEEVKTKTPKEKIDTINKSLPTHLFRRNNIVFLIDVSSSMRRRDRMPVLKTSMYKLFDILRSVDDVSLITYSSKSQILLESIAADEKELLNNKVDSIEAKGLTYGVVGLKAAYEIAEKNFKSNANNQVIIATDGQFNSPDHSQLEMMNLIRSYANKGITLSIIGFGEENKYIRRMKNMARIGKGNFIHITDEDGVDNLLVDEVKANSKK